MDGTVIAFLRWFFGLQTVDLDDITVRLNEEGFGDTPIAEVQEALALLADEISDDRQEVLDRAAAHLSAVAAEAMAGGGGIAASVTVAEATGTSAQSADLVGLAGLPGVTVTTPSGTDSEGAAPPDVPAPSGLAPAADGAPATSPPATGGQPPAHGSAPPPPTYEAPPPTNGGAPGHDQPPGHEAPPYDPPPPLDDAPPEYPDTWAGYGVSNDGSGPYVEIDGERLFLEIVDEEIWGVRHGDSGEYELRAGSDGVFWANPPRVSPVLIDHLTPSGFVIPHPQGGSVEFGFQELIWHAPNGTNISFAAPTYEFYGLSATGVVVEHEDGYHIVLDGEGGGSYLDPESGQTYDSLDDLRADHPVDGVFPVEYPNTWSTLEVLQDDQGAYVEAAGFRIDLELDGQGGYSGVHLDYRLDDGPPITWTNTPDGNPQAVTAVYHDGLAITHPGGDRVEFHGEQFSVVRSSGFGSSSQDFSPPFEFRGLSETGAFVRHPDGYWLNFSFDGTSYVDPETGLSYDSLSELQEAAGIAPPGTEPSNGVAQITSGEWGGHEVFDAIDGYYIDVDDQRYYLQYDSQSAYIDVGGYQVREQGAGFAITVDGVGYEFHTGNPQGPFFEIPSEAGPVRFVFVADGGYTFYGRYGGGGDSQADGGWHALRDGELIDVPDAELYAYAQNSAAYLVPDDPTAQGQLEADGSEGVDDFFSINNAPDSVSITHNNGQAQLSIVYGGGDFAVPLALRDGGYFVTIGGQEYEVHTQGGTYFVVVDGLAFGLLSDPTAPGWPLDNAMYSIDTSPYVEPPPEPAETSGEPEAETQDPPDFLEGDAESAEGTPAAAPPGPPPIEETLPPIEDSLPPADGLEGQADADALPGDDESLETG